jgi:hypothetical protein
MNREVVLCRKWRSTRTAASRELFRAVDRTSVGTARSKSVTHVERV